MFRVSILLFISFLGCCSPSDQPLRDLLQMQQDAWNAGDIEAYMQGYLNSERLRFVGSGGETRGWQSVLDGYLRGYPDRESMGVLSFDILEIRHLGTGYAMIYGKYTLARINEQLTGLFTLLAEHTENGWRITHDHTSETSNDM